jgi:hypothetical protein
MNKLVPIGLGAAAVVGVLAISTQLFGAPAPGGAGGVPSPTPSPSAASAAAPSPTAPVDAGLPVGSTHGLIDENGVRGTVTIPAPGWLGEGGILVKNDSADPPAGAGMITFTGPLHVFGDPCTWESTIPAMPATTADELVTALAVQASRDASEPVEVTVGGYTGKRITLHVPDDADFSACDQGYFASWGASGGSEPDRYHQGPGQIDEVWALDIDGVLAVIDTAYYAGTPAGHVDELRAIVESATFETP